MKKLTLLNAILIFVLTSCGQSYLQKNAQSFYGCDTKQIVSIFGYPDNIEKVNRTTQIYSYSRCKKMRLKEKEKSKDVSTSKPYAYNPWPTDYNGGSSVAVADDDDDGFDIFDLIANMFIAAWYNYDCTIHFTFTKDKVTDVKYTGDCNNFKPDDD